ncbi:MAG: PrsW family intramembrane metalloprotease [Burkholderiaceae bacterium]|nr:PrsW family intramembrane metalloprotease [Microbacteriaceae bacterium]
MLGVVALAVIAYLFFAVGVVPAIVAFVMALVPLILVVLTIAWIDRWEPEPRAALAFALLWGGAASIAIALLFSYAAMIAQQLSGVPDSFGTVFLSAVVQAPIVEEAAKGLGILILFWAARRNFDGPVDGLVYGAMVGIGFAFTENIQYFGLALASDGLGGVSEIFFLRGILSPFAHVMFTACTGLVIGLAAKRAGAFGAIGYLLLGLIPAILLHALWNGASFLVTNFYGYYVVVQVPLFAIAIGVVLYLRGQERRITAERLTEYADVGWFTPAEVAILSTDAGRRAGAAWARRHGLAREFTRFTTNAARLAFARQRTVTGRARIGAQRDEAALLGLIAVDREKLSVLPPLP